MQDYDYYVFGCRQMSDDPMPRWQFRVAYALYRRHYYDAIDVDLETGDVRFRRGYFPLIPWMSLRRIAQRVERGREYAQSKPSFDDEGETGGPGVREPRRPVSPTAEGSAGRRLPDPSMVSTEQAARDGLFASAR